MIIRHPICRTLTATADTIRILVSTDNHVGYKERDPIRGDDSWKSFHEVMCLAKDRDVDMVLLAGDLFHENKPSRKSMYHVMRSLRMNCYGDKPCELEMLSDASEMFAGAFNHVNYEDPDINVAIPVFSIHGNHDDPSDNISIKPVLLQKGSTKLALYGMSNVRDERLFRTFRDGNVKFFRPGTQKDDWFNLMSVHQNHYAHTETSYLPEKFLPSFLDLVVWGHEHECILEPQTNAEQGFRVIQPGSSVATSLMPGEAVPKKVAILSIIGKEMKIETIRLTTVRPFVMREVSLMASREMRELAMQTDDTKPKLARYLMDIVEELIEEAKKQWLEAQREAGADQDEEVEIPKPLIRLRVDYTAPDGGEFDLENPQRFSNRFMDRVANTSDVVQFHRKRQAQKSIKGKADMPEDSVLAQMEMDTVKIGQLVDEFLAAQSLTILPQNTFSDAVGQFVDKDDRTAMEQFVTKSLESLVSHLIDGDEDEEVDEERVAGMMEEYKAKVEEAFAKGEIKRGDRKKGSRKPRPEGWDSEDDGAWEDNPASIVRDDEGNVVEDADEPAPKAKTAKGRGGKAAAGSTRKTAATAKKAPAKGRGKKAAMFEEDDNDDDEDDDVVMANSPNVIEVDDDEEEGEEDDDDGVFVKPAAKKVSAKGAPAKKAAPAKAAKTVRAGTQSKLAFGGSPASQRAPPRAAISRAAAKAPPKRVQEPSDDEISDDDAFEPPPPVARGKGRR
ncbi:meiotic recombination [Friedmanniomyces endolithicus]|nr:meiotic recombination [Friedmanniomyces endolithicus]